MARSARREAFDRLNRIDRDAAYAGLVGAASRLSDRDERFVTELVSGVTRWRRWLDFAIDARYSGAAENLEPAVRQILRIGVYELWFTRTPSYAAVNEAADLARAVSHRGVVSLVNGLLRAVERAGDERPSPRTGDPAEDLAVRFSHPTWLVRRWLERFGAESTRELLRRNNERPVYGVRANALTCDEMAIGDLLREHAIEFRSVPYMDDFVIVDGVQEILRANLLEEGYCSIQGPGAGSVVRLLDPRPGESIVDLCSAPGGKAIYTAERMMDRGRIVAVDRSEARLKLVARDAERIGASIIETSAGDARALVLDQRLPAGDGVLLDVPCSGTGVLNRRADLRWKRTAADLEDLVELQDELLDAAASIVRPGGRLVYSTCSIEPEENEERVRAFLARHSSFVREPASGWLPQSACGTDGFLRCLPHVHGFDGAFAARLRKTA